MGGNGDARPGEGITPFYDTYLDLRLAGEPISPAEFLADHPEAPPGLRARLEALDRELGEPPAPPPAPDGEAVPFDRLGEFDLLRPLDAGGMGMVFLARQRGLEREVALKIVRPELRGSATALERFRREAQAVARLRHPHIVTVFATGEDEGVLYLAMELVPGAGLDTVLARDAAEGRSIAPARAVRWCAGLARALAYAHERGIVHRDVKPANVRLTPDDEPVLLDFGIARDETAAGATLTKTFAGSPQYAAPEQLTGAKVDGRADVYGLGVLLYQALTGRVPFAGGTMETILRRVLGEDPVAPRQLNPGISKDLDVVVLKALEKEPERRYASAAAFADDLEAVLADRPVRARRPSFPVRARRWTRRRPRQAAVLAGVLLVALVVSGLRVAATWERRADAEAAVAQARARLGDVRRQRERTEERERELARLRKLVQSHHLTEQERSEFDRFEEAVGDARREREAVYYDVLQLLRRAERLDPDVAGADGVRAQLFAERWRSARANDDVEAAEFFGERVAEYDPNGELARRVLGPGRLVVESDPPGARVYLFAREKRPRLGPRLVSVPVGDTDSAVAPGTHALRVVTPAGDVRRTDLVVRLAGWPLRDLVLVTGGAGEVQARDRLVSIDGQPVRGAYEVETYGGAGEPRPFVFARGQREFAVEAGSLRALGLEIMTGREAAERGGWPATLWRDGELVETVLPPGLEVRVTATPLLVSPRCRRGPTPLRCELPFGRYVVLLRKEGFADSRATVELHEGREAVKIAVKLARPHPALCGFVHVGWRGRDGDSFWIMEREVTCAEYRAFLADPAVRAEIAAADESIRVHRNTFTNEIYGEIGPDGSFRTDPEWRPDWPAMGLSWEDAAAYARWKTKRVRAAGHAVTFLLPSWREWSEAGGNALFPFGDIFRQRWMSSCYARRHAFPEPVLRFPVDESPLGVFDMAGGAMEWLDRWKDEPRGLRALGGGSWALAKPHHFSILGPHSAAPDTARGDFGFRLIARVER